MGKSQLEPTENLQFIGALFRHGLGLVQMPTDRWTKIQMAVHHALMEELVFCQQPSCISLLTLQMFQVSYIGWCYSYLGPHLWWWQNPLNVLEENCLLLTQVSSVRDVLLKGWSAHLNHQVMSGLWSSEERRSHINVLEFKALINAVHHWRQILYQASLMVAMDNTTVASHINCFPSWIASHINCLSGITLSLYCKWWSSSSTWLTPLQMWAWHLTGVMNVLSDTLLQPSNLKQHSGILVGLPEMVDAEYRPVHHQI